MVVKVVEVAVVVVAMVVVLLSVELVVCGGLQPFAFKLLADLPWWRC